MKIHLSKNLKTHRFGGGKLLPLAFALLLAAVFALPFFPSADVAAADNILTVEKISDSVILSWQPYNGDLDGYSIYIDGSISTDEYPDTSLNVTPALTEPKRYTFTVYTIFNGVQTEYANAQYDNYVNLAPVTEVRLQDDKIVWDAVSGASGYTLYIEGVCFGRYVSNAAKVASRLVQTKSYSVAVVPYSTNRYYVQPQRAACTLRVSNTPKVGKLYLSAFGGSLTLSWAPVVGASSYRYTVLTETQALSGEQGTLLTADGTSAALSALVTSGDTAYVAAVCAYDGEIGSPSTIKFTYSNGEITLL